MKSGININGKNEAVTVAMAKAFIEWPDGNEYSSGGGRVNSKSIYVSKGLFLVVLCLMVLNIATHRMTDIVPINTAFCPSLPPNKSNDRLRKSHIEPSPSLLAITIRSENHRSDLRRPQRL